MVNTMSTETRPAPAPTLNPYDTGERCEPHIWVASATPGQSKEQNDRDRYGKVDFDNDSGETLCTVYVEKNPDGTRTVHVQSMCDAEELTVQLHPED